MNFSDDRKREFSGPSRSANPSTDRRRALLVAALDFGGALVGERIAGELLYRGLVE